MGPNEYSRWFRFWVAMSMTYLLMAAYHLTMAQLAPMSW
jgi:hypothetical protein